MKPGIYQKKRSYYNFWSQTYKSLAIEKDLKTENTKKFSDNTKDDDSENLKKKLKDISNTDKETY